MGETLSAVWEQVTALLNAGVSIIPVRDREIDGKPPKTPYAQWKQYQSRIIDAKDLWKQMEDKNTAAIAIICGKVSGNLEAIDIDVKNWPGIDARYFQAIHELYPQLWDQLRIHSTPSGGFHILYRVDRQIEHGAGNQKLATASHSTQAGIETRGEGGYIVAPPSLGYQVFKDCPIPVITLEQRESLINLAKSLDEKIKVVALPTVERNKMDFYDENPFEHYNRSNPAETILTDHGWSWERTRNIHYQYFTRPGKDKGISASFNVGTRLYYIFTSGTALEPGRAYHPATLLLQLQFHGDKKLTYEYLVSQGYGSIKPAVERRIVRSRALSGDELPANVSDEAKVLYTQTLSRLQCTYPHGTYWVQEDDDVVKINRERLYTVSAGLGFRHYNGTVVQIAGYLIKCVSSRTYFDTIKAYVVEEEADFLEAIRNALESFIQRAGEFTIGRLPLLDESKIIASFKKTSYKFFTNGIVKITAADVDFMDYSAIAEDGLIWESAILPRPFTWPILRYTMQELSKSIYYQFLDKAIGVTDYLLQLIGYLCHDYKNETMGYLIVLVEQCEDPKQGGGTGKNLFCNLLGNMSTLKNIAGVQVQLNEKLLQAWNYERLLVISDVPKHFSYSFFKEPSMGSGIKKNLFKDEIVIPPHQMPKFIFSTNYSYENVDGGLKRRIRPIEFTPYFTKCGGVDTHFGILLPYEFDAKEWACFDWLVVMAIQQYLASDGKIALTPLSETGWLKQFDQTYHYATRTFIQEHWEYWKRITFVSNEAFKIAYDTYCNENGVHPRYKLTAFRLNQALDDWSAHYNYFYDREAFQRQIGLSIRGKSFMPLTVAPF